VRGRFPRIQLWHACHPFETVWWLAAPLRNCPFTPELQWQSTGQWRILQGCKLTGNAGGRGQRQGVLRDAAAAAEPEQLLLLAMPRARHHGLRPAHSPTVQVPGWHQLHTEHRAGSGDRSVGEGFQLG
jgi:hypothetical protein